MYFSDDVEEGVLGWAAEDGLGCGAAVGALVVGAIVGMPGGGAGVVTALWTVELA